MTPADPVEHPAHYERVKATLGVESADVIEALGLDWHLGNAFKYLWRAGHKAGADDVEDLRKCVWYLNRAIQFRTRKPTAPNPRSVLCVRCGIVSDNSAAHDAHVANGECMRA